ncbi:hypothetical protein OCH239_20890 [Roseivivax halodurans JCM 10272]|uniref:Pilus assembly protein n=1 Tax=Roseivivax halodurans JCM 10272 TaxID=1449350 RepID=X7EFV7_9RHOB|nr:hypothetical protein [Roseivivax halodurans]ETX14812.1 hypothetical protein OCH239_20890 [Roseivivax halodurans JCM 10272]
MIDFLKTFRKDEDGAVTVDWVVLTAAVVGLAVAAFSTINTNAKTLTGEIGTSISNSNTTLQGINGGGDGGDG